MNHAEIAQGALDILDRDGWCKFSLTYRSLFNAVPDFPRDGSHCIGGAVNLAMTGQDNWVLDSDFYGVLAGVIREQYPDHRLPEYAPADVLDVWFIAEWNNNPGTTEADVRRVLEKIAAS
jgi:hypothetical protein